MRTFSFNQKSLRYKTNKQGVELEQELEVLPSFPPLQWSEISCILAKPSSKYSLKVGNWVLTVNLRFPSVSISVTFCFSPLPRWLSAGSNQSSSNQCGKSLGSSTSCTCTEGSWWQIQIFLEPCEDQLVKCDKTLKGSRVSKQILKRG